MIPQQASDEVGEAVEKTVKSIKRQIRTRGTSVKNVLRNAELEVLKGQRSGRVYKKVGTHGRMSKATRELSKEYNHKLRGGQLYRASAPGEAPAKRNGALRSHWTGGVEQAKSSGKGSTAIAAYIESNTPYAGYLENGTRRIAPRPYVGKVLEKAQPEIEKIMRQDYS